MATEARVSGASVVNAAWRSWAAGTEATTPVPAAVVGAAACVAVAASGTAAIVGRTGSTAAGLSGAGGGQQGERVEPRRGGRAGGVRGVGDRHGLRDGDRGGAHRGAEAGDDEDRRQYPPRDRGTADPDAPAPDSTEVVGATGVGARALIVVEHLSGSPRCNWRPAMTSVADQRLRRKPPTGVRDTPHPGGAA